MGDEEESRPLLSQPTSPFRNSSVLPWDPSRAKKSGILILVSVTFERLAYYAVVMNLFLYLNKGQEDVSSWDPIRALTAVFVVNGVSYLSAPFGGWLSDAWVGRYWAIIFGKLLYILGLCLLTALSVNKLTPFGCNLKPAGSDYDMSEILANQSPCAIHVYIILVLIGIGVGCMRANIPPFGAEQVRALSGNSIQIFFTTYYWCINVGSLMGVGLLGYIQQDIEQGFFISYLTATISLGVSLVTFAVGRVYYVVHMPGHSVISSICGIVAEGLSSSCKRDRSIQSSPVIERRDSRPRPASPSWIDRAKISYGGSYHDATVDDVKKLSSTLTFLLLLIPFWLVYFQMSTSFQAQGLHMRVAVPIQPEGSAFKVPAAWLTLFDQLFVLCLVPLLNYVIYPFMEGRNLAISLATRIAIGMSVSFLAVLGAAVLEHFRLETWAEGHRISQIISGTVYNASDISILWQIPQYCLIGASEVFAGVAGLEYAYSSSPRSFQGIVMGLYSALEGIGSFAGIFLVYVIRSLHPEWITDEDHFNEGHMDYYFYLLAVIQAVVLLILLLIIYLRWRASWFAATNGLHGNSSTEDSLVASALHSEYGDNQNS